MSEKRASREERGLPKGTRQLLRGGVFSKAFFLIRSVGEGRIDCREREWFVEAREVGGLLPWCEGHVVIWFIENLNGTSAARSHSSRRGAHLGRNPQVSLRKLVEANSEKGP